MLSGCSTNKAPVTSSVLTTAATTVSETATETTEETTKAPEPFKFKRHVHTDLLSEYVTEDMWESLYNLIDAVYAGEDSFKCSSKKAFEWCTDDTVIGTFLPPTCTFVSGGTFENGTGTIKYKMDKDKLKARIETFEKEVEKMLNEAIRTDYSDFEKIMAIYAYMCKNFQYDFSPIDGNTVDEFSDYACLMTKKGICCEIAGSYSYLLLQCDVEAMSFGGEGTSGNHDWTYIKLGGKCYHADATWALYGDNPSGSLCLTYFMMTEQERVDGCFEKSIEPSWIWPWKSDFDIKRYPATDTMFKELHDGCQFISMDTEKNIITYQDPYGNPVKEFSYGDL